MTTYRVYLADDEPVRDELAEQGYPTFGDTDDSCFTCKLDRFDLLEVIDFLEEVSPGTEFRIVKNK